MFRLTLAMLIAAATQALAQDLPLGPITDTFLEYRVVGAIAVVEAIVIAALFRMLIASYKERLADTKEMTRLHETNSKVLEEVKIALALKR